MSKIQNSKVTGPIAFFSSLKDDVWHDQAGRNAFESWHFDALSDDSREALVITFDDSYSFSSRYYRQERTGNGRSADGGKRYPAVTFTYSVDGKILMRAVNEFRADEFSANQSGIDCSIGRSSFRVDEAEYGPGFLLQIDLLTSRKCQLKAELEWLSIETDLKAPAAKLEPESATWNIVAPRSDVSGRITVAGRNRKTKKVFHFRGELVIDEFGEMLLQQLRHGKRDPCRDESVPFLEHVATIDDRVDDRGVRAGAADSHFFQRLCQRGFTEP